MTADSSSIFELLFEGPIDDRPETIRSLKAAFLVELNFPLERVQEIFSTTPTTIMTSPSKMELETLQSLIKTAGGKVVLISSSGGDATIHEDDSVEDDLELVFDIEPHEPPQPTPQSLDDDNDLDLFEPTAKTYELSIDHADDDLMIPAMLEKQPVGPQLSQITKKPEVPAEEDAGEAPKPPDKDKELSLGAAVESAELLDTSKSSPEPHDLLVDEPIPVILEKVEESKLVTQRSTAVDMVLQDLNTSLTLDIEEPEPILPPSMSAKVGTEKAFVENTSLKADPERAATTGLNRSSTPIDTTLLTAKAKLEAANAAVDSDKKIQKLPKNSRKIPWSDVIIPLMIGIPLVIGTNWLFLPGKSDSSGTRFEQAVSSIAATSKEQPEVKKESAKEVTKKTFSGETTYEDHSFKADLNYDIKAAKVFVTIHLQTPEPSPLSPEQVGRHEKKAPWLREIETDKTGMSVNNGIFNSAVQGRVYVEDNGNRTRLLMTVTIEGSINDDGTAQIEATVGDVSGGQKPLIEHLPNGKYQVAISGGGALKLTTSN